MFLANYLFVWSTLPFAASSIVKVPSGPVTVARGATASLPCEFTSDHDPSALVVTWQRVEDNRVVHSYYYQQDQLGRQSSDYRNRTELNLKQIVEGNATLAISNFGPEDDGEYLCVATNSLGSHRGVVRLIYAVYYSEPRLSIHLNSNDVTIQYETEGFPKPEVVWQDSGGQNLSDQSEVLSEDKRLYFLRSSYVTKNPAFNITFTLKNPAVHQEMQRHVIFSKDGSKGIHIPVVILGILCVTFMCSTCVLLWLHCHNKQKPHDDMMVMPNSNNHCK
ncbi:butyrophilin-like protein 1 [Triplophysa rosa]|uniref:V-set domain-containing T-cell activation inhibitor 1-like n=1 Tax=Triplophysa rosa TaxID=992332 RepID=A0A9W7WNY6_TRIRA|nr:butyrophilin-like protein 1 [Triplophysa rosa]KAI7805653.1 putative V-set domain-containing T-cell activation inhibitor 1-like [Triplophysa rosa]